MSQLNFAINIGANDQTAAAVNSAMSRFRSLTSTLAKPLTIPFDIARGLGKFLTGGIGLPGINMGLRPLVAGIDNLIERGAALEVTRKSFASLTGLTGRNADAMARSLVGASNGTLRQGKAMEIANRALVAGIDVWKDLPTIMDFASKKALSTGVSFELAIDQLVTGLSRGSPAFLDNFGLLIDGIDGVKRAFDSVKGEGAFDAMSPAQQKAELIRQAMLDIRKQSQIIGVSGKETAFVWANIKSQIGDATDKLFAAVSRNKSLNSALVGMRDFLGGITQHFEGGGTLGELLLGSEKGKSGGLFGGLKAVAVGVGETIAGVFLKSVSELPDLFKELRETGMALIDHAFNKIVGVVEKVIAAAQKLIEHVTGGDSAVSAGLKRLLGLDVDHNLDMQHRRDRRKILDDNFNRAIQKEQDPARQKRLKLLSDNMVGLAPAGRPELFILQGVGASMMASTGGKQAKGFFEGMGIKGDELLARSAFSDWFGTFQRDFPPYAPIVPETLKPTQPDPDALRRWRRQTRLTNRGAARAARAADLERRRAMREAESVERELKRQTFKAEREAEKESVRIIRQLRREGREVTPEAEKLIKAEQREKFVGERTKPSRSITVEQRKPGGGGIGWEQIRERGWITHTGPRERELPPGAEETQKSVSDTSKASQEIAASVAELVTIARATINALVGAENGLAQAQT